MAMKYVVKKYTFGFDKDKAENYVASTHNTVNVDFKMQCNQVTAIGFIPHDVLKSILDRLIDSLKTDMEIGVSASLRKFATFCPSFGCKSQDNVGEETTDILRNRKIIFTPGNLLKDMINKVSIQKPDAADRNNTVTPDGESGKEKNNGELPNRTLLEFILFIKIKIADYKRRIKTKHSELAQTAFATLCFA